MFSRPRNAVLCALALSLASGYFVTGHFLYEALIGLDPSGFPLGEWIGEWIQKLAPNAPFAVAGPGIQRYAALAKNASVCASCSAPCTGTCPVGIDIQTRMTGAHEMLTLG